MDTTNTIEITESTPRTILKAISWQSLGILVMTVLGFIHTGSLTSALSLASSSFLISLVAYVLHEKLWQRVTWGKVCQTHQISSSIKY